MAQSAVNDGATAEGPMEFTIADGAAVQDGTAPATETGAPDAATQAYNVADQTIHATEAAAAQNGNGNVQDSS